MSTAPNLLRHLGGVPVASAANFAAWWGRKIWFSDFDSGTTGAYGNDMLSPQKNLKTILDHSDFGAGDGVFIKPRSPSQTGYVGDPTPITPATAVNWVIAAQDYGVHLIGTGVGGHETRLEGHASVTATPTLDVRAPYVNIENLGFRPGGSTSGTVRVKYVDSATYAAATYHSFGATLSNCHLRNADSAGALVIDSAWYTKVLGCIFSSCSVGVMIGASNSVPVGILIDDCDFEGAIAEITADIKTTGAVTRITMKRLYFNHVLPTGGSPNKYVSVAAASTGIIAHSYIGVSDATLANNMTLNGIGNAHIWSANAEST